jgi:hypothetical protein
MSKRKIPRKNGSLIVSDNAAFQELQLGTDNVYAGLNAL